jgi:hypothetical protein
VSLGLTFSEHSFADFTDVISSLDLGDHVRFNATIMGLGDTNHVHHLHAFGISKIDGHLELPAIVHENSRYKFKG